MGRPLKKTFLKKPTADGNEIKVRFFNGTASVDGWIVKQTGAKSFKCTDGTNSAKCKLVDKDAADLLAGEMSMVVKDDAGVVSRIVKISNHKVTTSVAGTVTGTAAWTFDDATDDNKVEIEEAGVDEDLTEADDFEV